MKGKMNMLYMLAACATNKVAAADHFGYLGGYYGNYRTTIKAALTEYRQYQDRYVSSKFHMQCVPHRAGFRSPLKMTMVM